MAAAAAAFAGKAVATSAISYIISKAFDYLKDNKKAGGLKSTKQKLEALVPQIQVIFDAVDAEQIKDQSEALDAWLWQLRDAVEEAEDALDELEYYKLEGEVKLRDSKVSGSLHKYKGKLVQQFNHTFNTGSLKRLKSAVKTLEAVAAGVERFLQIVNQFDTKRMKTVDFKNQRETSSLPHSVIGRDQERKVIVEWLTKAEAESNAPQQIVNNIPVFSIVGIGGLGKTALAQVICSDDKVTDYFDFIMWVCVSHDFDVEVLTRKILQEVTGEETNMVGLNALHKALKEKLRFKTFLLVLDDVWNDESIDDWENLARPLRYGERGSKILITTRMKSVADLAARAMQEECRPLRLSGLHETDLLVLLNMHAFSGVNPDDYRNLQQISKKMVNKLSGSPLAAKVLGGVLNNKKDSGTWNRILASDIHNIDQGKDEIMMVLKLSYQHLPTHLQACFRYCSLFHKNYEFKRKELVHLWMGSGLIPQFVNNMMPEEIGMEYLDTLTKKSFFDIKSRPLSYHEIRGDLFAEYSEHRYVIHDLLHELACSASVKECVRIDRKFSGMDLATVRHLYIETINPTVVERVSQAQKLRTLVMQFKEQDQASQEILLQKVLSASKNLRVFSLTTSSIFKLPSEVGGLVHLRYLSLIRVRQNMEHFSWFPESVYKLYHLQLMKFDDRNLVVPKKGEMDGLCNLVNLRHLYVPYWIFHMVPYVGKMTSLHELYSFYIKHQSGYSIGELKNLKDICHLNITCLRNVKCEQEATNIMLDRKENLSAVSYSWSPLDPTELLNTSPSSSDSYEPSKAEKLLDKLQPNSNICKLKIQGYPGSRSPCWLESLELIHLTYLYLCDCEVLQHLPPIGRLPSLQYLYIRNLKSVALVDSSFYGSEKPYGLQSLRVLEIEDMPRCTEWVGLEGENLFPQLERLVVRYCKELRQLPNAPISVRHIEIHNAGLQAIPLPQFIVSSDASSSSSISLSLSKFLISCCPNLETLWGQGYSLSALEELSIQRCESLSCLPEDSLGSLPILDHLEITRCPNLRTGEIRWPHMVRWLTLGLCGDAEPLLIDSLQGLKSLRRLFLDGCAMPLLPSEAFACLTGLISMVFSDCAMTCLPSAGLARMKNLENLDIWDCKELVSLDGIQWLNALSSLTISGCSSLVQDSPDQSVEGVGIHGCVLKLNQLAVDHPSLLLREPLRSLTTAQGLRIYGGPELTLLPEEWLMRNCQALEEIVVSNASHLQRLPQEMASLTSLKSLHISHAEMLQGLPCLPSSLSTLRMDNCHSELKKRCKRDVGPDWRKISHVHDLNFC